MKNFDGEIFFLDRADINTDEIIPAKYLTEVSKAALKPHLLEDLEIDGFDPTTDIPGKSAIISRANFGCGSSREHAPWALETNGIHLVIAESFARIFRQNMYNCGMLAVELNSDKINHLFEKYSGLNPQIATDLETGEFTVRSGELVDKISFLISEFDRSLIEAGGWLEFADQRY